MSDNHDNPVLDEEEVTDSYSEDITESDLFPPVTDPYGSDQEATEEDYDSEFDRDDEDEEEVDIDVVDIDFAGPPSIGPGTSTATGSDATVPATEGAPVTTQQVQAPVTASPTIQGNLQAPIQPGLSKEPNESDQRFNLRCQVYKTLESRKEALFGAAANNEQLLNVANLIVNKMQGITLAPEYDTFVQNVMQRIQS